MSVINFSMFWPLFIMIPLAIALLVESMLPHKISRFLSFMCFKQMVPNVVVATIRMKIGIKKLIIIFLWMDMKQYF